MSSTVTYILFVLFTRKPIDLNRDSGEGMFLATMSVSLYSSLNKATCSGTVAFLGYLHRRWSCVVPTEERSHTTIEMERFLPAF